MSIKHLLNFPQRKKQLRTLDVADTDLFFFYGSLMERYTNFNRFIKRRVRSLRAGYCRGYLYYLPMGFPALIYPEDPCTSLVAGELMTFNNPVRTMHLLDRLENYNPLSPAKSTYIRKKLPVIIEEEGENGPELRQINAWVYTYPEDHLNHKHRRQVRIECGQWTAFRSKGQPEQELQTMATRLEYCDQTQSILIDSSMCSEPVLSTSTHLYGCQRFCDRNRICAHNRALTRAQEDAGFAVPGCVPDLPCTD